jgi:hypothetical protein
MDDARASRRLPRDPSGGVIVNVYRTLAEGQHRPRHNARRATGAQTAPSGRIHAAQQGADVTLCGRTTEDLVEFGRSRFAFERTPTESRCSLCDERAGHPRPA